MKCYYCKTTEDLRPYGPKGAMVCFECAMETPERQAEAEQQFSSQLLACGGAAIIGEECGPYPANIEVKHD